MSENSGFFNAVLDSEGNPDRAYEATDFAAYYANLISNGVFAKPADQLQVCATTGNLKVKVNAGHAYIKGYWYHLSEDADINIPSNSSGDNRYDEVVLRLNLSTREIKLITIQGADTTTSNSFPTPIVSRTDNVFDLVLAQIRVNNSGTISNADIRDVRPINAYCGFVKGLVDDISTTDLFKQYDSMFNTWFDRQKYTLEDTPVGKLQKQIDNVIKDNGIACIAFNRLNYTAPADTQDKLGEAILIDTHNVFVPYNYKALSLSERPSTQGVSQAQSFIRLSGTLPTFSNFNSKSVYCRGSCFDFYNTSQNACYLKITEPGEYKINLTSFGSVAFASQADYGGIYNVGLGVASKSVSNILGVIPIAEGSRPTASGTDYNYQKSLVVKITDDVLPLFISAGIYMYNGTYTIGAKTQIAIMPSFEYTIEPVKLTRGIPQDLINMVATTPEGYEELKANDKIDPETAYFVSDGTNVILYLGEVKMSTSKDTSLGAIQELLTGTKTSIIGQQGSVE